MKKSCIKIYITGKTLRSLYVISNVIIFQHVLLVGHSFLEAPVKSVYKWSSDIQGQEWKLATGVGVCWLFAPSAVVDMWELGNLRTGPPALKLSSWL